MAKQDQTWVTHQDGETTNPARGLERTILAYSNDLMCVENSFARGAIGEIHTHPHLQIVYVAEGVFEFTVEGETCVIRKGDSVLVQGNLPHGCICLEKGILLDMFTPMRQDFVS